MQGFRRHREGICGRLSGDMSASDAGEENELTAKFNLANKAY
jgi:hypothetical protein